MEAVVAVEDLEAGERSAKAEVDRAAVAAVVVAEADPQRDSKGEVIEEEDNSNCNSYVHNENEKYPLL